MALLLKYKVSQVSVYPFGLSAQIEHMGHGKSIEEILILLAGLFTHFLFPWLFYGIMQLDLISYSYYEYLVQLNFAIFLFNLLPVYPLDGGRLLDAILHLFFNYQKARNITLFLSCLCLTFLILFRILHGFNMLVMVLFLVMQISTNVLERSEDRLLFYYYRYLHPIKHSSYKIKGDLNRNKAHVLLKEKRIVSEGDWLKEMFSK